MTDEIELVDGIKVPSELTASMSDINSFRPNPWNPNRMDAFMRERLIRSIQKDGFIVPIIVRPSDDGFEIVDGEQRWTVAKEDLGMTRVPYVSLGNISDSDAQAITIKANTLKGEFDSVELAKIIKDLSTEYGGIGNVAEELPYTEERLKGMVDLLDTDMDSLGMPEGMTADKDDDDEDDGEKSERKASAESEFKTFDPEAMEFDHECPRCKFKFNTPK